jgi:hypothetical protein
VKRRLCFVQDSGFQQIIPARPNICRLMVFNRPTCPSTWQLVQKHQARFGFELLCGLLRMNRSSYWCDAADEADDGVRAENVSIAEEFPRYEKMTPKTETRNDGAGPSSVFQGFVAEDKVHVHDLHATILHLLGLDHLKLTHRDAGRDFRITDVHGEVVRPVLA